MTTFAIGDIQGCYRELKALLLKLDFNSDKDQLWFAGDIVNRGPESLKTIRFIKSLEENAITVLGNHDLHLLALANGTGKLGKRDTIQSILAASDSDSLINWLIERPLVHYQKKHHVCMVHAGLYPEWTLEETLSYSKEVEDKLHGPNAGAFFENMYGDTPSKWSANLTEWDRLRFITNCFTRMRYINDQLELSLKDKGAPGKQDKNIHPWFELDRKEINLNIVFGHWSTLKDPKTKHLYPLDTGCLWGGKLTALKISKKFKKRISIACEQGQPI